jgi:hypothetical protein
MIKRLHIIGPEYHKYSRDCFTTDFDHYFGLDGAPMCQYDKDRSMWTIVGILQNTIKHDKIMYEKHA